RHDRCRPDRARDRRGYRVPPLAGRALDEGAPHAFGREGQSALRAPELADHAGAHVPRRELRQGAVRPRGRARCLRPLSRHSQARAGIRVRVALGVALLFAGSFFGVEPGWAGTFTIDPAQSALVVQVFKDGVAARLAHDHVVQARAFSGTIAYDPRRPDASSIEVKVEVGSLQADNPATRRKFGLEGEPSPKDRADIEATMKSDGQLAAARFPAITFASTSIAKQPDRRLLVTGQLTIRGVAQEVKFPVQIALDGGLLRGRAQLTFKQSSFGYQPYRAALGTIKNKDEVILHIHLGAQAP